MATIGMPGSASSPSLSRVRSCPRSSRTITAGRRGFDRRRAVSTRSISTYPTAAKPRSINSARKHARGQCSLSMIHTVGSDSGTRAPRRVFAALNLLQPPGHHAVPGPASSLSITKKGKTASNLLRAQEQCEFETTDEHRWTRMLRGSICVNLCSSVVPLGVRSRFTRARRPCHGSDANLTEL